MAEGYEPRPSEGIEDITSKVTFSENVSGTSTVLYVKNNQLYVYYQGESKNHSAGDTLFTLPNTITVIRLTFHPFVINGLAFGNVSLNVNGVCSIAQISEAVSGRVYASFSVPLA